MYNCLLLSYAHDIPLSSDYVKSPHKIRNGSSLYGSQTWYDQNYSFSHPRGISLNIKKACQITLGKANKHTNTSPGSFLSLYRTKSSVYKLRNSHCEPKWMQVAKRKDDLKEISDHLLWTQDASDNTVQLYRGKKRIKLEIK